MKKTFKIILALGLMVILTPLQKVFAASGGVSISGPSSLDPGESGTYTISFSADDTAFFQYSVSGNNVSLSGETSGIAGSGESKNASATVYAVGGSSGSASISVSVTIATTGSNPTEFNTSNSKPITITTPSTGGGNTGGGNTGGGNTGGGNTGGGNTGGGNTGGGNTGGGNTGNNGNTGGNTTEEPDPSDEEAVKEKEQKTPLIATVDVVSNSSKRLGEVLTTLTPEFDTWDYEFTLPKRIDKFILDIKPSSDDVTLTYDQNHEFKDGEPATKEIPVRAVKGDVIQEFKVKITKDETVPTSVTNEKGNLQLIEDETIDEFMTTAGFTRNTFKSANDVDVSYYTLDQVNVQLLVNDKKEAQWYVLDEKQAPKDPVTLKMSEGTSPLFILDAPTEIAKSTFKGEQYTEKQADTPEVFKKIDPEIVWKSGYNGWKVDEGELVYGMQSDAVRDTYHIKNDGKLNVALVSFDSGENSTYKTWAYVSTGALVVLGGGFASYVYINERNKKLAAKYKNKFTPE